ncbi:MAG: DegV family protein [Acholeplasmataceae bacterium]|nr:DegV family protein [Acholeplasmataceae bacterium]
MAEKIGLVVCGNSGVDYMTLNYPVKLIRSTLNLDGKEYEDYIDIQASEFYKMIEENPNIDVSTSQTSTGKIASVYEELKEEGYTDVIVVVISSKLSGTFQGAILAKQLVKDLNVYVLDSRTVSYGEAYLIMEAIRLIKEGKKTIEIIDYLEKIRDHIYIYVLVDTLKFLVKNGRLSATSGFLGTLLKIKPLLHIQKDGSLVPLEKIRTTNKAQSRLIEILEENIREKNVIIFISYTNNKDKAQEIKDILLQKRKDISIELVPLTPVVGAHAGPGTLGVGYIEIK